MTIESVLVNHNTANYAELALRSLYALNGDVALSVTLLDNASTEPTDELFAYAASQDVPVVQTGHTIETGRNTHGENLTSFMLDRRDAEHFLLMDADTCFLEAGTIAAMCAALQERPDAWAVQARMTPFAAVLYKGWKPRPPQEMFWRLILQFGDDFDDKTAEAAFRAANRSYHGAIQDRPHPFCLLIRNSPDFQRTLANVGLSTAFINADLPWGGWYDTGALAARVLAAQGLRWLVLDVKPVLHYANVSERNEDPALTKAKIDDCERRLDAYRTGKGSR